MIDFVAPLISVKEARKLLGVSGKQYSDDNLNTLIRRYEQLASLALHDSKIKEKTIKSRYKKILK